MDLKVVLASCLLFFCCSKATPQLDKPNPGIPEIGKHYLALGDSYTIGESVSQQESFPYQLVNLLNNAGRGYTIPTIVAKTGWTTDELQSAINAKKLTADYDLVTLCIGVNNQYRGYDQATYRKEFKSLVQQAISFARGKKQQVFVVSIPDWGKTPFGQQSGQGEQAISAEIDAFNNIAKQEADALGISFIDITPESRNAKDDRSLVAKDGLHPSEKMYAFWASSVFSRL